MRLRWMQLRLAAGLFAAGILSLTVASAWAFKAEDLSKKIDELEKTLGPEYLALAKGLERMDPASREGQEIVSIIESLDKSCED